MTQPTVEDLVATIKIAIDDKSPFKGMIDLSEIFDLPLETQQAVYDALSPEDLEQLKAVYGPKEST